MLQTFFGNNVPTHGGVSSAPSVTEPGAGNWNGQRLFVVTVTMRASVQVNSVADNQTGATYKRIIRQSSPDGSTSVEVWAGKGTNPSNLTNIVFTAQLSGSAAATIQAASFSSSLAGYDAIVEASAGGNSANSVPSATLANVVASNDYMVGAAAWSGAATVMTQDADATGGNWVPGGVAYVAGSNLLGGHGRKSPTVVGNQTYNPTANVAGLQSAATLVRIVEKFMQRRPRMIV